MPISSRKLTVISYIVATITAFSVVFTYVSSPVLAFTSIADITLPTPTPASTSTPTPTPTATPTPTPTVKPTATATPTGTLPDTGINLTYILALASAGIITLSIIQLRLATKKSK